MALSVTSITPDNGATAGLTFVTIEGTDFDMYTYPPATPGYIGDPGPSLRVKFGVLEAKNVRVREKPGGAPGETIIECTTPRYTGEPSALPALVDVTVENLLNPDTVVVADGFTYKHQDAKNTTSPGALLCTNIALLKELARQLPVEDVVDRTHTDYDDSTADGLNVVKIAATPALLLEGPDIDRADGIYHQADQEEEIVAGEYKTIRAATFVDLTYKITLIDKHTGRLLNLVGMLISFIDENGRLGVELVPGDPSQGFVYFDLDWVELPTVNSQASKDNLRSAVGTLVIHGVPNARYTGVQLDHTFDADDIVLGFDPFAP